jgi:hypothetical protein
MTKNLGHPHFPKSSIFYIKNCDIFIRRLPWRAVQLQSPALEREHPAVNHEISSLFSSVADPELHSFWSAESGSGFALVIRIRIQEGQNYPEKLRKFKF